MAKASAEERRERLAKALRANLRRRKGRPVAVADEGKPEPQELGAPEAPPREALSPHAPAG
ncbi:MAG TPA: hypothetical protein VHX61_04560 [Rhizomicrobium sp.]|nr:hypothetical protein [Rhizomicrobium sp.]